MAYLVWDSKKYTVNVDSMDIEHSELVSKMNLVYDAQEAGKSYEEICYLMDDLGNYIVKHFKDEEEYMMRVNYQGTDDHVRSHHNLLKAYSDYVDEFKEKKFVPDSLFSFLTNWLTTHICIVDREYSPKKL